MRQWANAFVILLAVALVAAFTVSSILAVVTTSLALRQSLAESDDLADVEAITGCDRLDVGPCLWTERRLTTSSFPALAAPAWADDAATAAGSTIEAGGGATYLDP